jgi:hypothetical protein
VTAGAARARKSSLNAILDKLSNRAASVDHGDGVGSAKPSETKEGGELRAGAKRSASLSGFSPPGPDTKMLRAEQAHKPHIAALTIPPSTIPSPAHSTPPHTSPSFASPGPFSIERRWSTEEEVGLDLTSKHEAVIDLSLPKDAAVGKDLSVAKDLSLPKDLSVPKDLSKAKDKGRSDTTATTPMPPPRPDSRERVSPKDVHTARSVSPSVGGDGKVAGGTKFNGDSSKDKGRVDMEVFKVPTPKTQSGDEGDSSGGSRFSSSPVRNSRPHSNPTPASPQSDASSPDNDLIIDCGDVIGTRPSAPPTKTTTPSPTILPSPKRVTDLVSEVGSGRASSNVSPSVSGKTSPSTAVRKPSPQMSPHNKLASPTGQALSPATDNDAGAPSPYMVDDDLMDMALTG